MVQRKPTAARPAGASGFCVTWKSLQFFFLCPHGRYQNRPSSVTVSSRHWSWAHRRSGVQGEPSPAHSAIQGFSWSFSGPVGLCASMLLRAGSSSEPSQSPSQVKLEPWVTKTRKDKFHPSCPEPFLVPVATRNKPRRGHYEPAAILRGST